MPRAVMPGAISETLKSILPASVLCRCRRKQGIITMTNYKLLLQTLKRNKFQKVMLIAGLVLFAAFQLYTLIFAFRDKAQDLSLSLYNTIYLHPFYIIFFMFFSFDFFSRIKPYKETFAVNGRGIMSVYASAVELIVSYILILTGAAILFNVINIAIFFHFNISMLFYALLVIVLNFLLPLLAASCIGMMLSAAAKKYIAYFIMIFFVLAETSIVDRYSAGLYNMTGYDLSKILRFFNLLSSSYGWSPVAHTGTIIELDKIAHYLFWIFLSAFVLVIANDKRKGKKWIKSGISLVVCALMLTVYFTPMSFPRMNLGASGAAADYSYYANHPDCQNERQAQFKALKYDLKFSSFLNLKADAKIYIDKKDLKEYIFTLYHGYKVSNVTNQKGDALKYEQKHDYLTIYNNGSDTEYIQIEYSGASNKYYSSYVGTFLPGNFAFYPLPGFYKMYDADSQLGFLDVKLPYNTDFNVELNLPKTTYCSLNEMEKNKFSGKSDSLTILSGYLKDAEINGAKVIYPYFSNLYTSENMNENLEAYLKKNPQIKKIFVVPSINLTEFEACRTREDYIFTNSIFDMEKMSFYSKISVDKMDFYTTSKAILDENADYNYIEFLKENASDEEKHIISLLEKLSASDKKTLQKEINKYLIDDTDQRSVKQFLSDIGDKYA